MEINYRFLSPEDRKKYIEISLKIWGCVPVDAGWAIETKIYKDELRNKET